MELSVVIPVFNEEESLVSLHEELASVMQNLGKEYEVIYVDDGSSDSSVDILKDLKKRFSQIKIISFIQNEGQSSALYAGFRASLGEWIITLDADGQNSPQDIPSFYKFIGTYDFITGVRRFRKDNLIRKASSSIAKVSRRLVLGDETQDTGCSLRIFRREVIGAIPFFKNFHRFFTSLVKTNDFSVKEIEVNHRRRKFGRSKYSGLRRTCEGIFDLWGVYWLKKRMINYKVKHED